MDRIKLGPRIDREWQCAIIAKRILLGIRMFVSFCYLYFKEWDHGANVGVIGIKNQSRLKRRLRHLNQGLQNETVQVESITTDFPDGVFRTEIDVLIVLK
jgi:hypothetical protein